MGIQFKQDVILLLGSGSKQRTERRRIRRLVKKHKEDGAETK
jgi:hypothetical protein